MEIIFHNFFERHVYIVFFSDDEIFQFYANLDTFLAQLASLSLSRRTAGFGFFWTNIETIRTQTSWSTTDPFLSNRAYISLPRVCVLRNNSLRFALPGHVAVASRYIISSSSSSSSSAPFFSSRQTRCSVKRSISRSPRIFAALSSPFPRNNLKTSSGSSIKKSMRRKKK